MRRFVHNLSAILGDDPVVFHADFALATARFMGTNHKRQGRNGQDYVTFRVDGHSTIAAVGDGCGSNEHSEIGCGVGIEMLVRIIQAHLTKRPAHKLNWQTIKDEYLEGVKTVVKLMTGSDELLSEFVRRFFLHTVVLVLIDDDMLYVMRFGDGFAGINGELVMQNGNLYDDTGPPFLANELLAGVKLETVFTPAEREFQLVAMRPIDQVETFFVGTDGLRFWPTAEGATLPGREEVLGPLTTLMDPQYALEPERLQQLIRLIGTPYPPQRPGVAAKTAPGYFADDVAVVVGALRP